MAHSGKDSKDLPKPLVGHGHPLDPNRGKVLSEGDEKRIDEEGRPIVDGLLWSQAASGAYIFVCVSREPVRSNKTMIGATVVHKNLAPNLLTIGCTVGKPIFNVPFWGAALEVPTDLGRDAIKRDYVAQWLAHTAAEALTKAGTSMGSDPILAGMCAQAIALAGNNAINELGF